MELGDADDPMNAWYFGMRDELFAYRLIGQHPTMSGRHLSGVQQCKSFLVEVVRHSPLLAASAQCDQLCAEVEHVYCCMSHAKSTADRASWLCLAG
jgi:hypothetical protein